MTFFADVADPIPFAGTGTPDGCLAYQVYDPNRLVLGKRMEEHLRSSIDANRGDPQNGWDTDQFPNSVDEMSLALYEIVLGGGFETGGFLFDTKLRRQSVDRTDLFHGHVGGIDTLARSLLVAESMINDGGVEAARDARYEGWGRDLGRDILGGSLDLATLADRATENNIDPAPRSGRQEHLENEVNRHVWSVS